MTSRTLYTLFHFVTVAITACSAPSLAADSRPPNVIFIIADDLGYGELGSYGQQKIRTPHLDEMAAEGMRFTQMYSGNAVCAPSRCVLMTGKHPGHTHVRDNRQWSKARSLPKLGKLEFEGQEPLPDEVMTLAEAMKGQGYTTGGFGKWGLGGPTSTGEPLKQGFDRWFGYNCQAVAHNFYPTYLWDNDSPISLNNPPFSAHDSLKPDEDPGDPKSYARFQGKDYAPDLINEAALNFARKNKDRPFFLYWPTTRPTRVFAGAGRFPSGICRQVERSPLPRRQGLYPAFLTARRLRRDDHSDGSGYRQDDDAHCGAWVGGRHAVCFHQ